MEDIITPQQEGAHAQGALIKLLNLLKIKLMNSWQRFRPGGS